MKKLHVIVMYTLKMYKDRPFTSKKTKRERVENLFTLHEDLQKALINDKKRFAILKDIRPDDFESPIHQWVYENPSEFNTSTRTISTAEALRSYNLGENYFTGTDFGLY